MCRLKRCLSIVLSVFVILAFTPIIGFANDNVKSVSDDYLDKLNSVGADIENDSLETQQLLKDINQKTDSIEKEVANLEAENANDNQVEKKRVMKALADDSGESVITISTIEDLNDIRFNLSGSFLLTTDLDLSSATKSGGKYYNDGKGWNPINNFTGTFDGDGHSIIGLNTKGNGTDAGLFGHNKGVIKNLTLNSGAVSIGLLDTANYAGGVAGRNTGTIENCTNYNTISGLGKYIKEAGGIAGYSSGEVINCNNHGKVYIMSAGNDSYGYAYAGGLVGSGYGVINGNNNGDVECISECITKAGGIIGDYSKEGYGIDGCHNEGAVFSTSTGTTVTSTTYAGGICGDCMADITASDNDGVVTSTCSGYTSYGGGIVGRGEAILIDECHNNNSVYTTSNTKGSATYSGGIAGYISDGGTLSIVNSWNDGMVTGSGKTNIFSGGIAGSIYGGIKDCYNTGMIAGNCKLDSTLMVIAGGITGYLNEEANASVTECYNTGSVYVFDSAENTNLGYCGGICGIIDDNTFVSDCYSRGTIGSFLYSGGVAGINMGIIRDCYFAGHFLCAGGIFGGIAARNYSTGTINNVYSVGTCSSERTGTSLVLENNGNLTGSIVACDLCGVYPIFYGDDSESLYTEKNMTDMKKKETFPEFNFGDTWRMGDGRYSLPVLVKSPNAEEQNDITIELSKVYHYYLGGPYTYCGEKRCPLAIYSGCRVNTDYTYKGGGVNAGTYKITATGVDPLVGTSTGTFKINKAKNTMKASGKTVKIKAKTLKSKNKIIKKASAFTVSKAKGTVKFKKKSGNKKILVSSAGKITIKKGLKKGTYKIKVTVTAAGTTNYKKMSKTVTVVIKVIK